MKEFSLRVKKLNKDSKINEPARNGDAGYDVFAADSVSLMPQERYNMPLGIALEFPDGYFCQVNQKSGLSQKLGIDTIGNVIDSGYRGEIHAIIVNTSNKIIHIESGQKIAQLVFISFVKSKIKFTDELSETERGSDGFGSTGNK